MKYIYITLSFLFISYNTFSQSKCKFIGYTTTINQDYQLLTYCGSKSGRPSMHGEERYTTASFYDYTLKRMFYIEKRETRPQYCYSWGYWSDSWMHKGFKDNFIKNKYYYFNLKNIEYTLEN